MSLMQLKEEQMVMDRLEGSEIKRLLNFKGSSRLEVKDSLTEKVLEQKNIVLSGGLKFCFIESKKYSGEGGEWADYKILYSIPKYKQTLEYLQVVLSEISNMLKDSSLLFGEDPEISYISLEEFDCSRPRYYYVLLGVRKDIGEEEKENEITNLFKEYYYE